MRCPFCKENNDRVIDSRESTDAFVIRRRRECLNCHRRVTTYERIEETPLRVVKKEGARVPFERRKILIGLMKACEKRPVPSEMLEEITQRIENFIAERYDREVPTKVIGALVMRELKKVDHVAYVRFASVYRDFQDVEEFATVADELKGRGKGRRGGGKKGGRSGEPGAGGEAAADDPKDDDDS